MKFPYKLYPGIVVVVMTTAVFGVPTARGAELPETSVYQLDVPLETQEGKTLSFADLEGEPRIVSMFYASFPHVCPMLISSIKELEKQLPEDLRNRLKVAMITVDPERDSPEALREIAERHNVDENRWTLARTTQAETRALAAVLGIKYKALPDGEFNHTTAMILLDDKGREIARSGKLGVPAEDFVSATRELLSKK